MRVIVDFDVCASTGSCMQICPEVFELRSDGYLYILQEEPPGVAASAGRASRRHVPDGSDHGRGLAAYTRHNTWRGSATARFGSVWVSTPS